MDDNVCDSPGDVIQACCAVFSTPRPATLMSTLLEFVMRDPIMVVKFQHRLQLKGESAASVTMQKRADLSHDTISFEESRAFIGSCAPRVECVRMKSLFFADDCNEHDECKVMLDCVFCAYRGDVYTFVVTASEHNATRADVEATMKHLLRSFEFPDSEDAEKVM